MKTCKRCGVLKDEGDFYLTSKGRPAGRCKECTRSAVRANYKKHADTYREYDRKRATLPHRVAKRQAYALTEQGRARSNEAKRRYIERNPVKSKAVNMVSNAVRDGLLIRQSCEVCTNPKAQAHHDDYSKPLDVRWLCSTHHAEWHRHNTPLCPEQEDAA